MNLAFVCELVERRSLSAISELRNVLKCETQARWSRAGCICSLIEKRSTSILQLCCEQLRADEATTILQGSDCRLRVPPGRVKIPEPRTKIRPTGSPANKGKGGCLVNQTPKIQVNEETAELGVFGLHSEDSPDGTRGLPGGTGTPPAARVLPLFLVGLPVGESSNTKVQFSRD